MKRILTLLLLGVAHIAASAEDVTLNSLLAEMTDPARLATMPVHEYRTLQASSYDRGSVSPGQPGWFANADWSHFIRVETNQGRVEHVMMDDEGPGAIVRFWNTWFAPMDGKLNHSTDGIIRIYLDREPEPVIAASQSELMIRKTIIPTPFAETAPATAPEHQRAYNLYLPIPYARHCTITYETKGKLGTVWNKGEAYYYVVNYRKYAPGTPVRTFRPDDLTAQAGPIAEAGRRVAGVPESPTDAETRTLEASALQPGVSTALDLQGPAAIRELRFHGTGDGDPLARLRGVEVQLDFDGQNCVRCPVGDFFGTGTRVVPFRSRFLEATADGSLFSRWVMPFGRSATLRFVNHGTATVSFACTVRSTPWAWSERSMHFRAVHAPRYGIDVRKEAAGARDMTFASIQGRGRLVGDVLAVANHASQGFKWWGEGDEKIYVDGETFPSHFGTGTEDYYGYAHCRPEAFASPFHAQPYGNGNLDPGATAESRSSVNLRLRLLDDIPFTRSLQFDMELWHWQTTRMDYVPTTFLYLRPQ